MTLLECLYKIMITDDATLAAKLPGGVQPRLLAQSNAEFQTTAVVRMVSGAGERPTHEGASPWCQARIEITVWGKSDKVNEQAALYIISRFLDFNDYLGGSSHGLFCCREVQGPRFVTDEKTRLGGVQVDLLGPLNRSTLS